MIRLKNLLKEITLMSGDAGSDGMQDFYYNIELKILPKKYHIVSDWMDTPTSDGLSAERKELWTAAKKVSLVNSEFKSVINTKLPLIAKRDGYELRLQKKGKDLVFHLVDPKAKYIYEYFIGIIRTEPGVKHLFNDPKKAFNLKCHQIHWSNVAKEHMGKGLGRLMYTLVYEYVTGLGAALISDTMLFQGSQKMWFNYIPSVATYFGVVVNEIFFPIEKAEVTSDIMSNVVSMVVAMENPPIEVRKLAYNVKGLSFKSGEYGVIRMYSMGINDKIPLKPGQTDATYALDKNNQIKKIKNKDFEYTLFSNLVDEVPTLINLFKKMNYIGMEDISDVTSNTKRVNDLKACVFRFYDMNVIVKEQGGKLVMVAI